ncbi:hypothetical protein [Streptosporangium sp. NBC_01469]|uniref:hypothetical protein n=1 Tax=Streptosporangium sp. NBC_01469 TaxID=2903898 RepID=UPI002E27D45B|nr:hypothetical protein [Streptosporangium sp. NBC_01469]
MFDVDSAPNGPGLYAWYVRPQVSISKSDTIADEEEAAAAFLDALQRYALVYEPPSIDLRGESAYEARWAGKIHVEYPLSALGEFVQPGTPQIQGGASDTGGAEESAARSLFRAAHSYTKRNSLTQVLDQAIPIFAAPLYIGIAADLKKRLSRHKSDFTRISDYLRNRPDDRSRAIKQARSFGHRAAARQVAMEDLEVWVLDLEPLIHAGMSGDDLRDITRSAEWYLHRLFSPILGRR